MSARNLAARTAFLFGLVALGAGAVDFASAEEPRVKPASWSGLYVGAHAGGALLSDASPSAITLTTTPFVTDPANFSRQNGFGGIGGIQAGYNWQFAPSWVVGAEADFTWASQGNQFNSGTLTSGGVPSPAGNFVTMNTHLNWLASVRGRVGYAWDKSLLYVTGGAAWANIDYSAVRNYAAVPPNNMAAFTSTSPGWVIGGGAEYAATANWMLRAEYLYYNLASTQSVTTTCSGGGGSCGGTPPVIVYSWGNSAVHVARVGLSYKF